MVQDSSVVYNIWAAHADATYKFSDAEIEAYVPDAAWLEVLGDMNAGSPARGRADQLELIRPLNPSL